MMLGVKDCVILIVGMLFGNKKMRASHDDRINVNLKNLIL